MSLVAIQIARPILVPGSTARVLAVRSAFVLVVYAGIAVTGAVLAFLVALLGWGGLALFIIGTVLSAVGLLLLSFILHVWKKTLQHTTEMAVTASRHTYMRQVLVVAVFVLGMVAVTPLVLPMVFGFVGLIALLGGGFVGVYLLRVLQTVHHHHTSSGEGPASPPDRRITTREP
jgi:hypothetical protein